MISANSLSTEAAVFFETLEISAIASDRRLISACDRNFTIFAAASWPTDIITTADFSISVKSTRLLNSASVTCDPLLDYLGGPSRVIGYQPAPFSPNREDIPRLGRQW